ncbi:hypothetical protein [Paenibacillus sacheonensis]|uniref:Uncharacterized protein n=1 Tax=Paenibacillus sacheonensis TaxID=742054 RepID=A0A7X5C2L5_9BACL|nr:hypothetical protein [Paenibacillus sacheonensis]MBM7567495.1 hypothetical protein [Paenibacillus sacheonensis]NBC71400.1 hypothetical protein [Paenibacillus sacheonensis]
MPKVVDINLDAGEMVLRLEKENMPRTIAYSRLDRMVKEQATVRKLLWTVQVKRIEMHVKGMDVPIVVASNNVGDYENVENRLMKVAEEYGISIEEQQ